MKKRLLAAGIIMILACATLSYAGYEGWETNFEAAKAKAEKENVPILINFAGSDWCGWCIKLDQEVFSQDTFKDYAKGRLVLFLADFPMQSELPEAVSRQNKGLAEKYGVQGFPTVLLVDKSGKILARTGYRPGGSEAYVEYLKKLVNSEKNEKES